MWQAGQVQVLQYQWALASVAMEKRPIRHIVLNLLRPELGYSDKTMVNVFIVSCGRVLCFLTPSIHPPPTPSLHRLSRFITTSPTFSLAHLIITMSTRGCQIIKSLLVVITCCHKRHLAHFLQEKSLRLRISWWICKQTWHHSYQICPEVYPKSSAADR